MKITIELTDDEYKILKTNLTDPESWIAHVVKEKGRKCLNRVYEATTGKIARKVKTADKIKELVDHYDIKPRTEEKALLKMSEKAGKE